MSRRRVGGLGLALVVAVALVPACSRGGDDDGFRLELDGRAEVIGRGDGDGDGRTLDAGGHGVEEGDVVRMVAGEAVLELPGDRSVLLRAAGDDGDADATVVEVGAEPDIREGDAVVVAGDDARVTAGDVGVELFSGAARVQRGLSVTVAVYAGSADVRAAGRSFPGGLAALRQLSVPTTGVLPRQAVPLVYDDTAPDPWDQRFIGDAIDLGAVLDGKSRGYTGQLGPRARADGPLLARALPGFEPPPAVSFESRTPGESLVGAAIAVEAGSGVDEVFSFRDAGARWGLVALDQQVQRDALLARIDGALGRSPLLFAVAPSATAGGSGGDAAGSPSGTTPPGTAPPGTTPTTQPPDGGQPPPPTSPVPTVPPPTVPPLPPITLPPLVPSDDEPEDSGSADTSPAPTEPLPSVVDTVDTVDDVVDGVVEEIVPGVGGEGGLL